MIEPGSHLERLKLLSGYREPVRFQAPIHLKEVMLEALAHRASDVFIQPNLPICTLVSGKLFALTKRALDDNEVKNLLLHASGRDTALTDIVQGNAVNSRYELFDPDERNEAGDKLRHGYRVNAVGVQSSGGTGIQIVIRAIPHRVPTPEAVGLEQAILDGATPERGIVYIAGATGQGKTTTFAAIIRYILENDTAIKGNCVSYEEPIEFRFDQIHSKHSIFVQTQVPTMLRGGDEMDPMKGAFASGIREAMRRHPALILIGELRDRETIGAAVEASLTGHPVFGTVHANDCASIPRRLISRFPEQERATAIFDIVETSRFFMAQRLVRTRDGKQTAAREYLTLTADDRERLLTITDMGRVTSVLRELMKEKGHSFAKEAKRLFDLGLIDQSVKRSLELA